jgi:hypothetical protein
LVEHDLGRVAEAEVVDDGWAEDRRSTLAEAEEHAGLEAGHCAVEVHVDVAEDRYEAAVAAVKMNMLLALHQNCCFQCW